MAHPAPIAPDTPDEERSLVEVHARTGQVPEGYQSFANCSARAALERLRQRQERSARPRDEISPG